MKLALQAPTTWTKPTDARIPLPGSLPPGPARQAESRRECRYSVDQPAEVFHGGLGGPSYPVRIRDISTRGMQLVAAQAASAGPAIKIRWNGQFISGTVRHSQKMEDSSFRLGVELEAASHTLVIEMLAKQSEDLQKSAFLVQQQESVLRNYLTMLDLATEWPGVLPQPAFSAKRYHSLLDLAPDAMVVTSAAGTVLFWNKAAEQLYGWSRYEAVGRPTKDLFEAEAPVESDPAVEGELRHVTKQGAILRVNSCSIIQQNSAGEPDVIISIHRKVADE